MDDINTEELSSAENVFKDMYSKLYNVPRQDLNDISIQELEQLESTFSKRGNKVQFKEIEPVNKETETDTTAKENILQPLTEPPILEKEQEVADPIDFSLEKSVKPEPLADVNTNSTVNTLPLSEQNTEVQKTINPVEPPLSEKQLNNTQDLKKDENSTVLDSKKIFNDTKKFNQPVVENSTLQQTTQPKEELNNIPDVTNLDKKLKMEVASLPEPPSIATEPTEPSLKVQDNKPIEINTDRMVDNLLHHPMHKAFIEPPKSISVGAEQPMQSQDLPDQVTNPITKTTLEPAEKINLTEPTANPSLEESNLQLGEAVTENEQNIIQDVISNLDSLNKFKPFSQQATTPNQPISQPVESGAVTSNTFNVASTPSTSEVFSNMPVTEMPTQVTSTSEHTLNEINLGINEMVKTTTISNKDLKASIDSLRGIAEQILSILPNLQGGNVVATQGKTNTGEAKPINSGLVNNYRNEIRMQNGSDVIDMRNMRGSIPGFTI